MADILDDIWSSQSNCDLLCHLNCNPCLLKKHSYLINVTQSVIHINLAIETRLFKHIQKARKFYSNQFS